jgi:hypothetical protein
MQYREIEYAVVQGIVHHVWKWSASAGGNLLSGQSHSKQEAMAAAEKAIDRALAKKLPSSAVGALQKYTRAGWPLEHDRELIALAKTHSLQAIAEKFDRPVTTILKRAARLGLSIKHEAKGKWGQASLIKPTHDR